MASDLGAQTSRWAGRVCLIVAATSVACAAAGIAIHVAAESAGRPTERLLPSDLLVAVLFPLAATLVLRRDPHNRCGWVLASCGLLGVSVLAHQWAYDGAVARAGAVPLTGLATWLAAWTYWPYFLQPTLLPVLFPTGRAPSRRWRHFTRGVLLVAAAGVTASMFKPDNDVEGLGLANPLGVGSPAHVGPWIVTQAGAVGVLGLIASPVAVGGLALRQRRASGRERAQLQWLLLGFATCLVLGVASALVPWGDPVFGVAFAAIPICIVVAVLRHGMLDVEVVVNRTIVYAALTGGGLVLYVAGAALVNRYAGAEGLGPLVAALVVAAAATGRSRLQLLVDRRLFGARRDPYTVVTQVGASTAAQAAPGDALQALVRAVQDALRVPFVQVLDTKGQVAAEAGAPVAGTHVVDVVDRGARRGVLVVGRRSRGERLRPEEASALADVARRAGGLLHARELTADVQRSYARTVAAREEERRRLRRDLHDGVGPALAGLALQLDSLAGRLHGDAELAAKAEQMRDRLRETVTEVRSIVDGLRPAVVDEFGLTAALQALATQPDDPLHIEVEVALPARLPAAIEAATYRIACEAVANATRHAQARRVDLAATVLDDELRLRVADDGTGFGSDVTPGVGLESMHERAAEVGGALSVTSDERGTTVTAILPVTGR